MIRVARAGADLGEFSPADVQAGLNSGRFFYSDSFCEQGDSEWLPLSLYIPEVKKKTSAPKKVQFEPTPEQEAICKNLPGPGELMLINAYAGSGKTETLRLIAERYPDIKFTYLCYNRDTAEKAKRRFPKNTRCSTIHSLAHGAIGRYYKQDFRMPTAKEVMRKFEIRKPYVAVMAVEGVVRYCNSSEPKICKLHFGRDDHHRMKIFEKYPDLVSISEAIWQEMINPASPFPISHDAYLKLWSLKSPSIPGEVILHDESQDMNPVTVGILGEQKEKLNPGLVIVGDSHQAIYAWRGAVNSMESLRPRAKYRFNLTTSFRFGQEIADNASKVLQRLKKDQVRIIGAGPTKSDLPDKVYIARKNSSLIGMAIFSIKTEPDMRFHFAGTRAAENWDPYYLYELQKPLDLLSLYKGRPELVVLEQMKKFESFNEVVALVEGDDEGDGVDRELEWYIEQLLKKYGDELPDLIDAIRARSVSPEQANLSFSTAHRSKGLEWKNVVMMGDFDVNYQLENEPLELHPEEEIQEVNALYVAMTRASSTIEYGEELSRWLNSKNLI
jgi:AAA domain/UvrD-like helicase C-terminal domain